MDKSNALVAFAALSQPMRLDVVRLLVRAGPEGLTAGAIGERLDVRQNTLSANLGILRQAGLVASTREGRSIRYRADFDGITGLLRFLLEDCCGGQPSLCRPLLETLTCCAPATGTVDETK